MFPTPASARDPAATIPQVLPPWNTGPTVQATTATSAEAESVPVYGTRATAQGFQCPTLSSVGLRNLSRVFAEASYSVERREIMLPNQMRAVQYFQVPPGALTVFRVGNSVRVVQHLAPVLAYCSATVAPGELGLPEAELLADAHNCIAQRTARSDLTRGDWSAVPDPRPGFSAPSTSTTSTPTVAGPSQPPAAGGSSQTSK